MDGLKIITELQKNSNENIDVIAKHCGFSRQKVWKIIKQWEKTCKIWGYTAIVEAEAQGLQRFMLSIKRSNKPMDRKIMNETIFSQMEKTISEIGAKIESSYYIHGEYDWILFFTAKDIQHAKKFADILFNAYAGYVDNVNISQVLYIQRDHHILNPDQMKLLDFL